MEAEGVLAEHQFDDAVEAVPKPLEPAQEYKRAQFEAVRRWFHDDWLAIDHKLRTSIVEGISVFLSLFDNNPDVKRIFCPPREVYTNGSTPDDPEGIPLPPFAALVEQGKVCALNFPMALNPGLAKAIGTMMKLDFQRAVLLRIPAMERERHRHHRDTFFVCDEYQNFATVGGNDPNGDEKFFSMSRQARCIPIIATQSISSLKEALAGEGWRTLLQTFRTKIFLAQSDEFSIQTAATLCGKEDRLKVSYGLSEASTDARVSLLTGKTVSNKDTISATKTYATQKDFIFDERSFTLLRNAECIVIPFDGVNQHEATYCYLKPWYLDREKSYWAQLRAGEL
ncbi:MAG: TraM recognition domain-containing protein [Terriglobales bacterium]